MTAAAAAKRADQRDAKELKRQEAIDLLLPKAIQKLKDALDCGMPALEVKAAIKILEYGLGKPKQQVDIQHELPREFVWNAPQEAPTLLGLPSGENGS